MSWQKSPSAVGDSLLAGRGAQGVVGAGRLKSSGRAKGGLDGKGFPQDIRPKGLPAEPPRKTRNLTKT